MIRVAITTDRFRAAAPDFRRLGLEPVGLPCIRVEPSDPGVLAQIRQAASLADFLVITSVRTLDILWPNGSMPAVEVGAVGERTAAAVAARGGRVVFLGRSGLAHLAQQMPGRLISSRVVFPHAVGSDQVALELLRARATHLREFEVYRSVPVAPGSAPVDAAAFASPSAVEGWHLSRALDGIVVGVIGPTTREAVAQHRPPDVMAARPSYRSLAQALASHLEVAV